MNVLHDGSKFSGPLRTHLHSSTPRFIYRYHEIQYQIAHLTIAAEAGDTSNVEGQGQDGLFRRYSQSLIGLTHLHTDQEEGQVDRHVIEEESAGQQPEEYSEQQWQDHASHEVEETEAPEETVTGDISHHSEDLLEHQEQTVENHDHAEVQDDDSGADSHKFQHERDEPSVAIDPLDRPAPDEHEWQEDSYQADQDGTKRLPASEPVNADADEGLHAPEELVTSAEPVNNLEVEREGDESTADNDDAHGWFHFLSQGDSHANLIICPADQNEQPSESLDQSHHISERLSHNGNIITIYEIAQIAYPFP